jgi:hypothetical protein
MPLIKPRTERTTTVRHITRLYVENEHELHAYAVMIGESTAYVLNALIDQLKTDKEFRAWRADHPGSYVPTPGGVATATLGGPARRHNGHARGVAPLV